MVCPVGMETVCSNISSSIAGSGTPGLGVTLFASLITTLLKSYQDLQDTSIYPDDVRDMYSEYDFIVVGAGTAGCVVANRLSEVTNWNILLLEAGGDPTPTSEIPQIFHAVQNTHIDWQYKTEPQDYACLGMVNRTCNWPRGKVLGGSSVLNAYLFVRGNRHDYDHWEALGNTGWGYNDVLKYFKKFEDLRSVPLEEEDSVSDEGYSKKYHSTGGYQPLEQFSDRSPIVDGLISAAKELGYRVGDINGKTQTGFTLQHGAVKDGKRISGAKAFLSPIKDRKNLHVAKYAQVTKIIIDPLESIASGVEFIKNEIKHVIRAKKEVILCAGSVNSPQILMLSGIGPKEHLQDVGIKVIKDLKVGDNLQDHMQFLGLTVMFNRSNPVGISEKQELDNTYQYFMHRKGPLAGIDILQFQGFVSTKYAKTGDYPKNTHLIDNIDYPDIQFQHIRFPFNDTKSTRRVSDVTGYTEDIYNAIFRIPNSQAEIYLPLTFLQRPKSHGYIRLRNSDPFSHPIINPRYLSDERDVKTIAEGAKIAMSMAKTRALSQGFEAQVSTTKIPGCDSEHGSDDYWECAIRKVATTVYHPSGTCKMGPATDSSAVVDPRLKVYGIKGLRVIDASIMPNIVTANINSPVVMIAEKGSDLIKEDWNQL